MQVWRWVDSASWHWKTPPADLELLPTHSSPALLSEPVVQKGRVLKRYKASIVFAEIIHFVIIIITYLIRRRVRVRVRVSFRVNFRSDFGYVHTHCLVLKHITSVIIRNLCNCFNLDRQKQETSDITTVWPVYENDHVMFIFRCVCVDRDHFWYRAKNLVWTENDCVCYLPQGDFFFFCWLSAWLRKNNQFSWNFPLHFETGHLSTYSWISQNNEWILMTFFLFRGHVPITIWI